MRWVHNRRQKGRAKSPQRDFVLDAPEVPGKQRSGTPGVKESEIQKAALGLLEVHPQVAFAFRVNTASGYLVGATNWKKLLAGAIATRAMARFIRFAFPGCSDILGMLKGGRFLACEVKTATGTLSEEQGAFLTMVNRFGGLGFIARSAEDVQRHLSDD